MAQSLTAKTIYGMKWSSASTIATSIMQIGYTAIMARLLDPAAFGLVAMAGVILRFAGFFADMGMAQALVQKADLNQKDIRSAFTSSLLFSIVFLISIWLTAPFATYFFDTKEVVPIIRVMVFGFIFVGFSSTSLSLIRRKMDFKRLAFIEIGSYILSYGFVGIFLAFKGLGVWSLVYATICQSFIASIASYVIVRHNVVLFFNWDHYKPLLTFGGKFSLSSFLGFIGSNLDTLVIGRFLGAGPLGIYNRAFLLINLPVQFLTASISRVLFPVWSNIQSQRDRLKRVFLLTLSLMGFLLMPIGFGAAMAAEQIIFVMLGHQWAAAIPIFQILAISTPFHLLTSFNGTLCDVTATLGVKIKINFLYIIVVGVLFLIFRPYGLVGFAFALFLAIFIRHITMILVSRKILRFGFSDLINIYKPGIFSGIITGGVIFLTAYTGNNLEIPQLPLLLLEIVSGTLTLILLLFLSPNDLIKSEVSSLLIKTFNKNGGNPIVNKIFLKTIKLLSNN